MTLWAKVERAPVYNVIEEYDNVTTGGIMNNNKVFSFPKDKLIEEITKNRDNHRAAFEAALGAYRDEVIKVLKEQLDQAERGERIPRGHGLTCPQDMTREYNQILAILDMTTDDEIELTQQEFACYVLDQWHWKQQFATTANSYLCNWTVEGELPPTEQRFGRALDTE